MIDERGYLANRRDRSIAKILSYKEDYCDQHLPEKISRKLRFVVMDEINDLVNLAFDMISSDIDINEYFLEVLQDKIDEARELRGSNGKEDSI